MNDMRSSGKEEGREPHQLKAKMDQLKKKRNKKSSAVWIGVDQDERRRLTEMRSGKQREMDKARLRKVDGRERERLRQNSQTEVDRNRKTILNKVS